LHDPANGAAEVREALEKALRDQFARGDFACRGYRFPALHAGAEGDDAPGGLRFADLLPPGARVPDGADLTGAQFPAGASFAGCTFGDGVQFARAAFADGADFSGATFGRGVSFRSAQFGEGADLHDAVFGPAADFRWAQFGPGAYFGRTSFGHGASFSSARLGESASFWYASFGAEADLAGAGFGEGANLRYASFGEGACLRSARFAEGANLGHASLAAGADLSVAVFQGANFRFGSLPGADLRHARFYRCSFAHCRLKDAVIDAETRWGGPAYKLADETRIERKALRDNESVQRAYADAEDAYRRVRQVLKENGLYHEAGRLYYRERVCRRRSFRLSLLPASLTDAWHRLAVWRSARADELDASGRQRRLARRARSAQSVFAWLGDLVLFDWSCGYGEKPVRLFGWALAFVMGFAVLYWGAFPNYVSSDGGALDSFWSALYFSVGTFATLGIGDYTPQGSNVVRLIVVSEAMLGALTVGLAMVTFARKAIRD
jgi:uncharacterized protein YjbI with pentapeptide repeats